MSRRVRALDKKLGDLVVSLTLAGAEPVPPATEPTIAVVIPAYNEAEGIVEVLRELPARAGRLASGADRRRRRR